MLVDSDFNSMLKESLLFSGILNKVDQMESKLVKQDEKMSNIREKIKGFGSILVDNHEKKIVLIRQLRHCSYLPRGVARKTQRVDFDLILTGLFYTR